MMRIFIVSSWFERTKDRKFELSPITRKAAALLSAVLLNLSFHYFIVPFFLASQQLAQCEIIYRPVADAPGFDRDNTVQKPPLEAEWKAEKYIFNSLTKFLNLIRVFTQPPSYRRIR